MFFLSFSCDVEQEILSATDLLFVQPFPILFVSWKICLSSHADLWKGRGKSIYDPIAYGTFQNCCRSIWHLSKSNSKHSWMNLFVPLAVITILLSLLENLVRISLMSLANINLSFIFNWTFYLPDFYDHLSYHLSVFNFFKMFCQSIIIFYPFTLVFYFQKHS